MYFIYNVKPVLLITSNKRTCFLQHWKSIFYFILHIILLHLICMAFSIRPNEIYQASRDERRDNKGKMNLIYCNVMIDKSSVAEQIFIQLMNCTAAKCNRFPFLWNMMVLYNNIIFYLEKYFTISMIFRTTKYCK